MCPGGIRAPVLGPSSPTTLPDPDRNRGAFRPHRVTCRDLEPFAHAIPEGVYLAFRPKKRMEKLRNLQTVSSAL